MVAAMRTDKTRTPGSWRGEALLHRRWTTTLALLLAMFVAGGVPVEAQTILVLALEGDLTPQGEIDGLGPPVAASPDRVLFTADLNPGAGNTDALVGVEGGSLTVHLVEPVLIPGEGIELFDFSFGTIPTITPSGDVLFNSDYEPVGGGIGGQGVFLYRDVEAGKLLQSY